MDYSTVFDKRGSAIKAYAAAMKVIDDAREERRRQQAEKRLNDSVMDAYEMTDATAGCVDIGAA